jgi:hypothetical protein
MAEHDTEFWLKAADARQELVEQYSEEPGVTLIDIGYPPATCGDADEVVLRVHVTEEWFDQNPNGGTALQQEVDGIPVCVIRDEQG